MKQEHRDVLGTEAEGFVPSSYQSSRKTQRPAACSQRVRAAHAAQRSKRPLRPRLLRCAACTARTNSATLTPSASVLEWEPMAFLRSGSRPRLGPSFLHLRWLLTPRRLL